MDAKNLTILTRLIAKAISTMKGHKITGASVGCIKQFVRPTGLTCSVEAFHASFASIAVVVAKKMKFDVVS